MGTKREKIRVKLRKGKVIFPEGIEIKAIAKISETD
jgi:hypothetical protein